MIGKTWAYLTVFLASFGVITFIVRSTSVADNIKILLVAGHIVAYLSVIFAELSLFRQHFGTAGDWLRSLSNVGRAGKKNELYRAMGNALGYLSDHAYVTYFNDKGPRESMNPAEEQYHAQFHRAISEGGQRTFRRIIALLPTDTPAKKAWVRSEIEFCERHDNYAIKFLTVKDETELPLNVQIFDNFVFLIDPNRDNEDTLPRDIHFLSKDIADIWFRYSRSLWDMRASKAVPTGYLPVA